MKRLVAYAQNESANIVVNGNFTEVEDDFSFYTNWTRQALPAGDLPSATSLPNPIDDTFNSVVRFHGSATNSSRIITKQFLVKLAKFIRSDTKLIQSNLVQTMNQMHVN